MTNVQALFQSTLKTHGCSITEPRRVVFEALQHSDPLTMNELVAACSAEQEQECTIDRASVYRTVKLFEDCGIVQRVHFGWKYRLELTDQFNSHHHHISCSSCGKVATLHEDLAIENLLLKTAQRHGYKAQSHQLEIRGLCADCQKL